MTLATEAIFARHLDLAPLCGRPTGLVICPFHEDRRPSLSLDLSRGLFHCFGCGESGGLRRFTELVGEKPQLLGAPRSSKSPVSTSGQRTFRKNRPDSGRAAERAQLFSLSDYARRCRKTVETARALATDSNDPQTWEVLSRAAEVERYGWIVEAKIDAILVSERIR